MSRAFTLLFVAFFAMLCASLAKEVGDPTCTFQGTMRTGFFNNKAFMAFQGQKYMLPNVNFFTAGNFPPAGVNVTFFGARFSGYLKVATSGTYKITFDVDDGARYFIDGKVICDEYNAFHSVREITCTNDAAGGYRFYDSSVYYSFVVEYNQVSGGGAIYAKYYDGGNKLDLPSSWMYFSNCTSPSIITTGLNFNSDGISTFGVKFATSPLVNTVVELESNCAVFSNCTLLITPANYNQFTNITVSGNHPTNPKDCCFVRVKAVSGDDDYVGREANATGCQPGKVTPPRSSGFTYGDPHFSTLDGNRFDNFGTGDFWFVRQNSGEFAVQLRHVPCAAASCNSAVAVFFRGATYYVYIDGEGNPTAMYGTWGSELMVENNNGLWRLTTTTGLLVTVSVGVWERKAGDVYYLGVGIYAGKTFYDRLFGLCGRFNGIVSDDFTGPNSAILTTDQFLESWRVTSSENLFTSKLTSIAKLAIGTTPAPSAPSLFLECPQVVNTSPAPTTAPPAPSCDQSPPPPGCPNPTSSNQNPCANPEPALLALAKGYCDPVFNSTTAKCCSGTVGLSGNPFYATCICDAVLTESDDFVYDSYNAFLEECMDQATRVGKTCNVCPGDCRLQGTCQSGVCKCNSGFSGLDCSENWNQPPTPEGCSPSGDCSIAVGCPSTEVAIQGNHFYGNNLECLFEGFPARPATKITNNKVVCTLPSGLPTPAAGSTSTLTLKIRRTGAPTGSPSTTVTSSAAVTLTLHLSCCSNPCPTNAECLAASPSAANYTCKCLPGWAGPNCDQQATCELQSSRSSITFTDRSKTETFQLKFTTPITKTITVTLKSDCANLDKCSLTFGPGNYNTPQTVTTSFSQAFKGSKCTIVATPTGDALCNDAEVTITVVLQPPATPGKTNVGSSYGDPHFLTYDGLAYDYFGVGVFYLTRDESGEFAVQAVFEKCAAGSCVTGVAARFRNYVLYYHLSSLGADGVPQQSSSGNAAANGVVLTNVEGNRVLLKTDTGLECGFSVNLWQQRGISYLSVGVKPSGAYQGILHGLYGNNNGDPADDLMSMAGVSLTPERFAQTWFVPNSENLFRSSSATIPAMAASAPSPLPTGCNLIKGTDDSGNLQNTRPPKNPPLPFPSFNSPPCANFSTPQKLATAEQICSPLFNSSKALCCSKLVSPESYYDDCVCDYLLSGDADVARSNLRSFYQTCLMVDGAGTCAACPNACSGNGNCRNGVCECTGSWKGDDCSENWGMSPYPQVLDPPSSGQSCPLYLSVLGYHFYGPTLLCDFGGVRVPATKVSNFQVVCQLPTQAKNTLSVPVKIVRGTLLSSANVSLAFTPSCCESPCLNGGTCSMVNDMPVCACPNGFFGPRCQFSADCVKKTLFDGLTIGPASSGQSVKAVCPAGETLRAQATCSGSTLSSPAALSCEPLPGSSCPFSVLNFGVYPPTPAGSVARGQCPKGFRGRPLRACNLDGTWSSDIFDPCERITCPAITTNNAYWPVSRPSATPIRGTCVTGFGKGSPGRLCLETGFWGGVGTANPCVPLVQCPAETFGYASWPATYEGSVAVGTCGNGYSGTALRECGEGGVWKPYLTQQCAVAKCPLMTEGNALWYETNPGDTTFGKCQPGFAGRPYRTCGQDGVFLPIRKPCVAVSSCPAQNNYAHVNWPATPSGSVGIGTCVLGYEGTPERECLINGQWNTFVQTLCERTFCPAFSDGIANYPATYTGDFVFGTCKNGKDTVPVRFCKFNKTFGDNIRGKCT